MKRIGTVLAFSFALWGGMALALARGQQGGGPMGGMPQGKVGARGQVQPEAKMTGNFYAAETGLRACREDAQAIYGSVSVGAPADLVTDLSQRLDRCLNQVEDNVKNLSQSLPRDRAARPEVTQGLDRLRQNTRTALDVNRQLRQAVTAQGYEQQRLSQLSAQLFSSLDQAVNETRTLRDNLDINQLPEPPRPERTQPRQ